MIFLIEHEGQMVSCSSARCVRGLLREGWRLTDPDQADALVRELARELPFPGRPPVGPRARSH